MAYPDKLSYKTTITDELRHDIMALGGGKRRYLEIGCDVGYTVLSVASAFSECVGIDIDPTRILMARDNALRASASHCKFIAGDSAAMPRASWDVILIDADHSYSAVKLDYQRVIGALEPGERTIIFHDYGLTAAGVRRFVDELASAGHNVTMLGKRAGWNPLGGAIDGPEAAAIRVHV